MTKNRPKILAIAPIKGPFSAPLSGHALGVLMRLERTGPSPTTEINAGVVWKLTREGYAQHVDRPSPYKVDLNKPRDHLEITAKGREAIT